MTITDNLTQFGLSEKTTFCVPVYPFDAGILEINSPDSITCSGSKNPAITIKNFGSAPLTSLKINYTIDTSASGIYNWTGFLKFRQAEKINLPAVNFPDGQRTFSVTSSLPNGNSDGARSSR